MTKISSSRGGKRRRFFMVPLVALATSSMRSGRSLSALSVAAFQSAGKRQHATLKSSHSSHRYRTGLLHSAQIPQSSTFRLFATTTDTEFSDLRRRVQETIEVTDRNKASCPTITSLENEVADLERESSEPSFWDDPNSPRTQQVNQQLSTSNRLLNRLRRWEELVGDCNAGVSLLEELLEAGEDDEETMAMIMEECTANANQLMEDGKRYELESLLSGPYDDKPARVVLTAGAGGTEACDWVDMLMRMYLRHAEKMGYIVTVEDKAAGDVVGYKSVELLVEGSNAYGWLRAEKGSHRLVRLSPFNANNKRQTTFGGVDVMPVLDDEEVADVDVPKSELEITTMRSGGAGGQVSAFA